MTGYIVSLVTFGLESTVSQTNADPLRIFRGCADHLFLVLRYPSPKPVDPRLILTTRQSTVPPN
ncbi:nucleoporin nup44 [Moniliophthora roreri]|uniref:Uncharacterized protein n=1 Tax=Moniliophthora roreri TaxID=221103 RepID=A0A0W0F171_MONRR|nr:nucleoporin nup44 [Moniliophthora roreri]